jgi:hypothetical protein
MFVATPFVQAASPGDLKDVISEHFVQNANNPQTQIAQTLAKFNQDTTDALNPHGIIALPVQETDMHQVTLHSENLENPWVNAVKNGTTCVTTNQDSKFLILLYSKTLTTQGSHEDKVMFTAGARLQLTRTILNNSAQSCDDPKGVYSEVQTTISLDRCHLSKITDQ